MFRKILVVFLALLFGMIGFAQPSGQSYNDLLKTAKQGDSKAQALVAYHLKEGIGVKKDLKEAQKWALTASESHNGFAYWLLAQIASEKGESPGTYRQYLESALSCEYPLAISLYARLYDSGSLEYGMERDADKAFELYAKAADKGDVEAAAYLGYLCLTKKGDPANAFKYFKMAALRGDAESMSMLGSMCANGVGTVKNMSSAYEWYKQSSESGSLSGLAGLADCLRIGQGVAADQPEAFKSYSRNTLFSSRLQYILGYYYAMGEGVEQDVAMALSLLKQSAASGNVYAQAVLGVAQYEGTVPFKGEKDVGKALPFLKSAYANPGLDSLPPSLLQKVFRYLSGFYRYGRGVERDIQLAEQLSSKADAMQFEAKTALHPFAYIGMMTVDESLEAYPLKPLSSPEYLLTQTTFDYPDPVREPSKDSRMSATKTEQKKNTGQAEKPTDSKVRFKAFLEAGYGLGAISSDQISGGWIKDQVYGASAALGVQTRSGLFLGVGTGIERFPESRKMITALQGSLVVRFTVKPEGRIAPYFEVRGGGVYEIVDRLVENYHRRYGFGLLAGGSSGLQFKIANRLYATAGVNASYLIPFDENYGTKCWAVMPTIGLSF